MEDAGALEMPLGVGCSASILNPKPSNLCSNTADDAFVQVPGGQLLGRHSSSHIECFQATQDAATNSRQV